MRYYRVSQRCRERGATSSPLRRGEGSSKFGGGGWGGGGGGGGGGGCVKVWVNTWGSIKEGCTQETGKYIVNNCTVARRLNSIILLLS